MIGELFSFPNYFYALFALAVLSLYLRKRKQPPGPYGLPIVGYYPFLGKDPVETLHRLREKYNDVMSITLFGEDFWILNSREAIEEAFVTKADIFSGRPITEFTLVGVYAKMAEGEEFNAVNKFMVGHLSQLGMGKSAFEMTIHNILDNTEKYIDRVAGKPFDYSSTLTQFTINIITTLIYSEEYKHDDEIFTKLHHLFQEIFCCLEYFNMHLTGNFFKYYIRWTTNYEKRLKCCSKAFQDYTESIIKEREKTFDEKHCKDLLDYWIKEYKVTKNEYFNRENMAAYITNLLVAGTETSACILNLSLHYMAANRHAQQRVYEEICDTIGTDGLFCYLDRERLPYTQAVISEVLRFANITPQSVFRVATKETTLRGYKVPKRQKVLANFYSLTRDPNNFRNPNKFDPNNFLDANGYYKPNKALLPFGIGPRKCTGFKLAEVEIFIAFVRLMRRYEWTFPNNEITDSPINDGGLRFPNTFNVCAKRRKQN